MKKGIQDVPFINHWEAGEFFGYVQKAGFEGVEINVLEHDGYLSFGSTVKEAKRLQEAAADSNLEIHSLSTNAHNTYALSSGDPAVRKKGEEIALKMIELAAEIGAAVIQIVPGCIERGTDYTNSYQYAQQSLYALGKAAEQAKIVIGIENVCNHFLPSPMEFSRFLDEINLDAVQAYFDIGNAMVTGYPEHWIPQIGSKIVNIHAKDYRLGSGEFVAPLAGDVQWPRIMTDLRSVRYEGYLMSTPSPYVYCSERLVESCAKDLDAILKL